jgi:hypothetical protein
MPKKVYVVTEPAAVRGIYDTWAACEAAVKGVPGARYRGVATRDEAKAVLSGAAPPPTKASSRRTKLYVITEPPPIRGIYDTWQACQAAISREPTARYQAVDSWEKARAMLSGEGIVLPPGLYAFTDGNHLGGVGAVVLRQEGEESEPSIVAELSTTVEEVFDGAKIAGLETAAAVAVALANLRNVLAELAALYLVVGKVPPRSAPTVVHDYLGVAKWYEADWMMEDDRVAAVVAATRHLAAKRHVTVAFRHQRSHQATTAGRDDFARWNARADALATKARPRSSA